jgi:acyl-CoA thioesterase FadM
MDNKIVFVVVDSGIKYHREIKCIKNHIEVLLQECGK